MKKILSTALVLSLAAGMLTGCGGGKSDDTNTLKISGLNGGYGTKGWEAVEMCIRDRYVLREKKKLYHY